MVLGSWLCPSWRTQKMPEDWFLPAELRVSLSAQLSAQECMFQGSIFSAGELTDPEREGTSPEDKLGKCRASVHPIPLPKHSKLERSHLLQQWVSCSPTCPGSPFPSTSPHCCRASCQFLSHKHLLGRSPAQVSRRCPHSHRQRPQCPQPGHARLTPETQLRITAKHPSFPGRQLFWFFQHSFYCSGDWGCSWGLWHFDSGI